MYSIVFEQRCNLCLTTTADKLFWLVFRLNGLAIRQAGVE